MTGDNIPLGAESLANCPEQSPEQNQAEIHGYVITPPKIISLAVSGTQQRFPIRRVYCLARNYAAHAIESGDDPDKTPPFYFQKPADAVMDVEKDYAYPAATEKLSYEVEMVVALKSGGRDISEADANTHIFGYAVAQDMTKRDLQAISKDMRRPWEPAKSFDNSAPCTAIHPVSETGILTNARIWLSVNGNIKQDSNINKMRWSIPQTIALLSSRYALQAGDIILTGTPKGVDVIKRGDIIKAGVEGLDEMEFEIV